MVGRACARAASGTGTAGVVSGGGRSHSLVREGVKVINPQAYGKAIKGSRRARKVAILLVAGAMLFSSLACKDDGRGGDSSWIGNTGVDGAMQAVPGNVAGGLDVLGQVLNK